MKSKVSKRFPYGTNAVSAPTSKANYGWLVALVIVGCLVALMSMSDGHTEYGYTAEGGRL